MADRALGLIEVKGYLGAVVAADGFEGCQCIIA